MRESLINRLNPEDEPEFDTEEWKAYLLALWTGIKWVALGLLAAVGFLLYFIFSIVFAGVSEKRYM